MLELIFQSAAVNSVKALLGAYSDNNDSLYRKSYKAIDNSYDIFFKEFENAYGNPSNSFLARQSNLELLIQYLIEKDENEIRNEIIREGYNNSPRADDLAVKRLIEILKQEFCKDVFLLNLLKLKELGKENQELHKITHEKIEKLFTKNFSKSKKKKDKTIEFKSDKEEHSLKEGVLYEKKVYKDIISYMRRGERVYSEVKFNKGGSAYFEITEDLNIEFNIPPVPLKVIVPQQYQLSRKDTKLNNHLTQVEIDGKWGLKINYLQDDQGIIKKAQFKFCYLQYLPEKRELILKPKFADQED